MKRFRTFRAFALSLSALAGLSSTTYAQSTFTWTNTTSDSIWQTSGNWNPSGPPAPADIASFTGEGLFPGTVSLNAAEIINQLLMTNAAGQYTFTGSGLTVGNAAPGTLSVTGGGVTSFNNALTVFGGSNVTVSGGSQLWLTNTGNVLNDNFITISNGTIRGVAGSAAASNSINSGAGLFSLSGGTLRLDYVATPAINSGFFSREFTGTDYTGTISAGDLGAPSATTSLAGWTTATPTNSLVYNVPGAYNTANGVGNAGGFPLGSVFGANITGGVQSVTRFFAPVSGRYTFSSFTDDGSRMFVDGLVVNTSDLAHGTQLVTGGAVFLTAGYHTIETQLLNSSGNGTWDFRVQGPNETAATVITNTRQYFQTSSAAGLTSANFFFTNTLLGAGTSNVITLNLPITISQATIGLLGIDTGSSLTLTSVTPNANILTSSLTLFADGAQTISVPEGLRFNVGIVQLLTAGAVPTITKTGTGALVFSNGTRNNIDQDNTLTSAAVIDVQQGVLWGIGASAGLGSSTSQSPFGAATIRLSGGSLLLDTAVGNATFGNAITVATDARIDTNTTFQTLSVSGLVTLSANTTLIVNPEAGNNASAATAGGILALTGGLSGPSTAAIILNSTVTNFNTTNSGRPFNSAMFGILQLTGSGSSFAGSLNVNQGTLQASGGILAANDILGTGPLNLNFGRLLLNTNGPGSNGVVTYGNAVTLTGGLGFGINVDRVGANTGNSLAFGTFTQDTTVGNNPQQVSLLTVTSGNSYTLRFTTASLTGPLFLDQSTSVTFTGAVTGTAASSIAKSGNGLLQLTNGTGTTAPAYIVMQSASGATAGTLATTVGVIASPITAYGPNTVVADSIAAATPAYSSTVNMLQGSVYRIDANKFTLPTISSTTPLTTPVPAAVFLNVANSQSIAIPGSFFLSGSNVYTGSGITAGSGNVYRLGGAASSGTTFTLTGDNVNPVLSGANDLVIGSRTFTAIGSNANTVLFNNAANSGNTFTGTTFIDSGFTAVSNVGGALTPFGTSVITVAGTLTYQGTNGSAVDAGNTANNNGYVFVGGSALNLTGAGSANNSNRWFDSAPIPLNGTALTLATLTATTIDEIVGGISFDGNSTLTITRTGASGQATLTAASIDRANRGTLRIVPTAGALNTTVESLVVTGSVPAAIGTQAVLPGYLVVQNTAPTFATMSGTNVVGLTTYSATTLNAAVGGTETVDVTAVTTLSANPVVASLRVGAFAIGPAANTVSVIPTGTAGGGLGGIVFTGTATHTSGFAFSTNEALVFVNTGITTTLTNATTTAGSPIGGISGSGGITKFGAGTLLIANATTTTQPLTLGTGIITVNQGTLQFNGPAGNSTIPLPGTNPLVLNGGTISLVSDAGTNNAFTTLTLLSSSAYIINRPGTTSNPSLNFTGAATIGEAGRADTLTLTGTVSNGSGNFTIGGTTTLNQDLFLSGGRVQLNSAIVGNSKNLIFSGTLRGNYTGLSTGLNSVTVLNGGNYEPSSTTFTGLGAPTTFYGGQFYAAAATTLTDSFQIYSGVQFNGPAALTFTPSTGNSIIIGVSTAPGPLTLGASNATNAGGDRRITQFNNVNLYFTAYTQNSAANANASSQRMLTFSQGTGTWNISGPIELNSNGNGSGYTNLQFIIPNAGVVAGTIPATVASLTTLRSNSNTNAQQLFAFGGDGVGAAVTDIPRIAFTQTILDGNLLVSANFGNVTNGAAHISLGSIQVFGDRTLSLLVGGGTNSVNTGNANLGSDFSGVVGSVGSILRIVGTGLTDGNALLTTDISNTMLGQTVLTTAGTWRLNTSGALGATGMVGSGTSLGINTILTAKDDIRLAGFLAPVGSNSLSQFIIGGSSTQPRLALEPGATFQTYNTGLTAGTGTTTITSAFFPIGLQGQTPVANFRINGDVNTLNGAGPNNALTGVTLGGANGINGIETDGTARLVTSGTASVAGPFFVRGQSVTLTLGGTVASNNSVSFTSAANLPAGYRGDAIVTTATNGGFTLQVSNSAAGGTAGDLSGIRRWVLVGGVNNQAVVLQGQSANSIGGTGAFRAGVLATMSANATANTLNPGPNGLNGAGTMTVQYSAQLQLDDANNITTTTGSIVLRSGSFASVTNAGTISGIPTSTPTIDIGNVVRIGVSNPTFLTAVGNATSQYVVFNGDRTVNTATANVQPISLNRNSTSLLPDGRLTAPWNGALTSDATSRTLTYTTGSIAIGVNGAILGGAASISTTTLGAGATLTYAGLFTIAADAPIQVGHPFAVDGRVYGGGNNSAAGTTGGGFVYTGTSTWGTSPITVAAGAVFRTPRTSLSTTNAITIDGALAVTGTAGAATIGTLTPTGYARVITTTGAGSSLTISTLDARASGTAWVLGINNPTAGALAGNEKVLVSAGAPTNFGTASFLAPWFVTRTDVPTVAAGPSGYLTYDVTNGFTNAPSVAFASATAAQPAFIGAATTIPAASTTVKGALTIVNGSAGGFNALNGAGSGAILQLTTGGIYINNTSTAAAGASTTTLGGTNMVIDNQNKELVLFALATGTANQVVALASQLQNITALTLAGGSAVQGVTAVVSLTSVQAGTGWAANTPINIMSGQLRMGVAQALPSSSVINFGSNGSLDLATTDLSIAGINGPGVVYNGTNNDSRTLTLNGTGNYVFDGLFVVQGTGLTTITKNAASTGTQTFTNNLTTAIRQYNHNAGVTNFDGNVSLNSNTSSLNVTAGTVNAYNSFWSNGQINISGTGSVNFGNPTTITSMVFSGTNGSLTISNAGAMSIGSNVESVHIQGNVTLSGTGSLAYGPNASHTVVGSTIMNQIGSVDFAGTYNVFHGTMLLNNIGNINFSATTTTINGANVTGGMNGVVFNNNGSLTFAANTTTVINTPTEFRQQVGSLTSIAIDGTLQVNAATSLDFTGVAMGANSLAVFGDAVTFRGGAISVGTTATGLVSLPGSVGTVTVGDQVGTVPTSLLTVVPGLTISRPIATGFGSGITVIGTTATTGTTTFSGSMTLNSPVVLATGSSTVLHSGVISSSEYGITKIGIGVLNLTAASTYAGGSAVSQGTLLANNSTSLAGASSTGAGRVVVSNGATLGGGSATAAPVNEHNILGAVVINAGGTLSPGNGLGVLTVRNNVTMADGAAFQWQIGNASVVSAGPNSGGSDVTSPIFLQDLLAIIGTGNSLTAGNITFRITETLSTPLVSTDSYSFTVATSGGTPTLGSITFDTTAAANFTAYTTAGGSISLATSGGNVYLNLAPVPEPILVGVLTIGGLIMLRRRK